MDSPFLPSPHCLAGPVAHGWSVPEVDDHSWFSESQPARAMTLNEREVMKWKVEQGHTKTANFKTKIKILYCIVAHTHTHTSNAAFHCSVFHLGCNTPLINFVDGEKHEDNYVCITMTCHQGRE